MADDVEINYDKRGTEKSVVVPYELYVEMLAAKNDYDDLKNRLNQLFYILSDVVAQPAPAKPSEIETPDDDSFDASTDETTALPETQETTEQRDIRYYQRARGFYVDGKRFCVLAGSKARGTPSDTFNAIESLSNLRDRLISSGVLTREYDWGDYGQIKNERKTKGHPLPENDVWIAAIAKQHSLTVVTRDQHFKVIDALLLEEW